MCIADTQRLLKEMCICNDALNLSKNILCVRPPKKNLLQYNSLLCGGHKLARVPIFAGTAVSLSSFYPQLVFTDESDVSVLKYLGEKMQLVCVREHP